MPLSISLRKTTLSQILFSLVIIFLSMNQSVLADTTDNPCAGPFALINIIDRPSVADSPCVVSYKKAVLETGYEYLTVTDSQGNAQNYPEAEFRLGLPKNTEIVVVLPNNNDQTVAPLSGWGATTLGVKHEIGYNAHWIGTVESLFTLPTGSSGFGSQNWGVAVNAIIGYTINAAWNVTLMLGGSTQTASVFYGGERYSSVNPDVILTYTVMPKINLYGEVYGQSQTLLNAGSGFNFDGGLIFLPWSFLTLDMEYGQRISGSLGNFVHYVGAGLSVGMGGV